MRPIDLPDDHPGSADAEHRTRRQAFRGAEIRALDLDAMAVADDDIATFRDIRDVAGGFDDLCGELAAHFEAIRGPAG